MKEIRRRQAQKIYATIGAIIHKAAPEMAYI